MFRGRGLIYNGSKNKCGAFINVANSGVVNFISFGVCIAEEIGLNTKFITMDDKRGSRLGVSDEHIGGLSALEDLLCYPDGSQDFHIEMIVMN